MLRRSFVAPAALAAAALVPVSVAAQTALPSGRVQRVTAPIRDAGILHVASNTWTRKASSAALGLDTICLGTVTRLATKSAVAGASQFPAAGDPSVSVRGSVTAPGTRDYQVWYRNAASFCTPATFNLTNGWEVRWTP